MISDKFRIFAVQKKKESIMKDKKILYPAIGGGVMAAIIIFLLFSKCSDSKQIDNLTEQQQELKELKELAEIEKAEMENEYENFANQYNEMKLQINNDSLVAQLEKEQQRTQELLEELKRTKSTDAAEILRLKKELATLREVLRTYVHEIDSLNQLNQALTTENQSLRNTNAQQQQHISRQQEENEKLTEKVTIAAQLNATGISAQGLSKRNKTAKKIKDVKQFQLSFTIDRNVTASAGNRTIYVRITTPTGEVLSRGGSFNYENRSLPYSIRKDIEYNGEETNVTVYWDVAEALEAGTYRFDIFADGNNIGSRSLTFEK